MVKKGAIGIFLIFLCFAYGANASRLIQPIITIIRPENAPDKKPKAADSLISPMPIPPTSFSTKSIGREQIISPINLSDKLTLFAKIDIAIIKIETKFFIFNFLISYHDTHSKSNVINGYI